MKNIDKFTPLSIIEEENIKKIITDFSNKKISDKLLEDEIMTKYLEKQNFCFDNNNCINNILDLQKQYIQNNNYIIPNLYAEEINTKKFCFKNNCITSYDVNKFKKYNYINKFNLFNTTNAIIYTSLDNNDVSGNPNTIIDVFGYNGNDYEYRFESVVMSSTYLGGSASLLPRGVYLDKIIPPSAPDGTPAPYSFENPDVTNMNDQRIRIKPIHVSPNIIYNPRIIENYNVNPSVNATFFGTISDRLKNPVTISSHTATLINTEQSEYYNGKGLTTFYTKYNLDFKPNGNEFPYDRVEIFQPSYNYTYKVPFNDQNSKYVYKLLPQHFEYYDTSGFAIRVPNNYPNLDFNVLWVNVPNYIFTTFKVCLYDMKTNKIIKKYGTFGTGLKFKNKFDDKLNLYDIEDGSGNYFDWIPVPIYGNDKTNNDERIIISNDRGQPFAPYGDYLDMSGFMISGIGFSTNPYNFSMINPAALYYNEKNQDKEKFRGNIITFNNYEQTTLNFSKILGSSLSRIRTLKTTEITGLNIKPPHANFSIQMLPPKQNNYKILYLIGNTSTDLTGIKLTLSISSTQEYQIDTLIDISNYPPYSLTNVPNIKGVIIDPTKYSFGEYFNAIKIILPTSKKIPINILEIGSFDLDKSYL